MNGPYFLDIVALTSDERLRHAQKELWEAVAPPSREDVEAFLCMELGLGRAFTDEERARAYSHLMHLRAEDILRQRLGSGDEDDFWDDESEEGIWPAPIGPVANGSALLNGADVAGAANDDVPLGFPVTAVMDGSGSRQDGAFAGNLGIAMIADGTRFALFRDKDLRICFDLGGLPAPGRVRLRTRHGAVVDIAVEDRGGHARLDRQIRLVDILEGAEDGVLPATFLG